MATGNKKDYLKKYLSKKEPGTKRKHKKKSKTISDRVRIIDDDADFNTFNEAAQEDLLAANEDAPQIAGIVDERPLELRMDDFRKDSAWQPVGAVNGPQNENDDSPFDRNKDSSPPRKGKTNDSSPPRRNKKDHSDESPVRRNKKGDSDESPPRSKKHDDESPPQRRRKVDESPPRNKRHHDESPSSRRKQVDESPPRRNRRLDDSSHNIDNEHVPPKKTKQDDDFSPPRKSRKNDDNSPPRKSRKNDDNSPPRKTWKNKDNSPPRKNKINNDFSPPRKYNAGNSSRHRNNDYSPPRKNRYDDHNTSRKDRFNSYSQSGRNNKDENNLARGSRYNDNSPSRRNNNKDNISRKEKVDNVLQRRKSPSPLPYLQKENSPPIQHSRRKRSRWAAGSPPGSPPNSDKMSKTLDGKSAGLQNANDLIVETLAFKKREDDLFKSMSADVSGANANTIVRDRKTGKIRDFELEAIENKEKTKKQNEVIEKYDKWGKGTKQVEEYNQKLEQDVYEMSKPLARYADDVDLEEHLKAQERAGDPMLAYIKKKKKKVDLETGKPSKPQFEGEFMPNRFGIRPGHNWDGVDRSNGYEVKWFEVINQKQAQKDEAYKWNSEDM